MAPLALFLCLVFSAWLLIRDSRRRNSVSAALWLPTIVLFILGSRPLSQWLGIGEIGEEGVWVDQVFYLTLIVGSGVVVFFRGVRWDKFFVANIAIMLFYSYFAASVLWSGDPEGSFKRWFKDFGMVFVISVILSEKDPLEAMRAVYIRCASVLIPLSVVLIRYYPELGQDYSRSGEKMFTGVTTQKNSLGEMVMVWSLFLVWDYLESRAAGTERPRSQVPWDHLVLLLLGLWLLQVSQSKTALICMVIGLVLMLRRGWLASRAVNRMAVLGALSLPFFFVLMQEYSWMVSSPLSVLGRDLTLTGRTGIWENVLADKTLNPLIGAGYFSYWGTEGGAAIREAMDAKVHSAHNGYVDIFLDGGLIGVGLLFVLLFTGGRRLMKDLGRPNSLQDTQAQMNRYQKLRFAFLIMAIVYNFSESAYARLIPAWFTTMLVLFDLPSLKAGFRKLQGRGRGEDESLHPVAQTEDVRASATLA